VGQDNAGGAGVMEQWQGAMQVFLGSQVHCMTPYGCECMGLYQWQFHCNSPDGRDTNRKKKEAKKTKEKKKKCSTGPTPPCIPLVTSAV